MSLIVSFVFIITACESTATLDSDQTRDVTTTHTTYKTISASEEYNSAIEAIAQVLALVLDSVVESQYLKEKMEASDNIEQIVSMEDFLLYGDTPDYEHFHEVFLGKLGKTEEEMSNMVLGLNHHTDIYIPVPEHRTSWDEYSPVLVAYVPVVDDGEEPTHINAFTTEGALLQLSREQVPTIPNIVITPCEHNGYHATGMARETVNVNLESTVMIQKPANESTVHQPEGGAAEKLGFIYLEEFIIRAHTPYEAWWDGYMEIKYYVEHNDFYDGTYLLWCAFAGDYICEWFHHIVEYQYNHPCGDSYILLNYLWHEDNGGNCNDPLFPNDGFDSVNILFYEDDHGSCEPWGSDMLIHNFENISIVNDGLQCHCF